MGIYDREYERGDGEWRPEGGGGLQFRWPRTTVGWVLLVTLACFLLELPFQQVVRDPATGAGYLTNGLINFFHLNADWFRRPWEAFTLLTYGLLHDPSNLFHVAGNMFSFWLFGRELEQRYGSREFLLFYVAAVLLGGLAFSLCETLAGGASPVIGASAGTVAVVILYAFNYPHRTILFMFILPMPMWVLGLFIVGSDVMGALGRAGDVAFTAHLGGAAFALAYHKRRWRLSDYLPDGFPSSGFPSSGFSMPRFKRRPKLRVYGERGHGDDKPQSRADQKASDRVDALLKKVHDSGLDSLTNGERKELERESRRARNRSD